MKYKIERYISKTLTSTAIEVVNKKNSAIQYDYNGTQAKGIVIFLIIH